MSYSCSDFTDDVQRKLGVSLPGTGPEDIETVADLCIEKIEALEAVAKVSSASRRPQII